MVANSGPSARLADWLGRSDRGSPEELVAEDACFHSPVADYVGHADVVHILGVIASVMDGVTVLRVVHDHGVTIAFVSTSVGAQTMEGVIVERLGFGGRIVEATLLLRPFGVLRKAISRMTELLAEDPLPSSRAA